VPSLAERCAYGAAFRDTIDVHMSIHELLSGLSVIAGLVVLEGLLSVDNVLGIAALANELPRSQQRQAVRVGLALAYLFRVLALLVASWLTTNTWVRWLGAAYLIWLMSSHLTKGHAHDVADAVEHEAQTEDAAEAREPSVISSEVR
jgi:predicted tellurium resistance membrane protein TerC